MLLVYPGATFPFPGEPTSVECARRSNTVFTQASHFALAITCVNRQIQREAYAFFYSQNDLVFAEPVRLQTFLSSLGRKRLNCLRAVTFHYNTTGTETVNPMESVLSTLSSLRGLRKLHVLLPQPKQTPMGRTRLTWDMIRRRHSHCNPARLAGAQMLFSFCNLTDIQVFGPQSTGEIIPRMQDDPVARRRLDAIFEHFNHGLSLAQRGQIYRELYADISWAQKEKWPALGTQHATCGLSAGCLCGKIADDECLGEESASV
jgi:hypothetical protein